MVYHAPPESVFYPVADYRQTRDSSCTYLHLHASHHADLLESFTNPHSSSLAPEDIYVPAHLQPVNPEDEDDVVPDQHAAFGIQRATKAGRETVWRDLGLEELSRRAGAGVRGPIGAGAGAGGTLGRGAAAGNANGAARSQRRIADEPVVLALRRRPGAAGGHGGAMGSGSGSGRGEQMQHGVGGAAGNGMPR